MYNFENKIAVVTGASGGIGAATASALAQRGAVVVLLARNGTALEHLKTEIAEKGGKAFCYAVDLARYDEVQIVSAKIKDDVGIPDIIVNNAGAGRWLALEETSEQEAVEMISVPYLSAFFITRNFVHAMLERNSGHIVNITSPVGFIPIPGAVAYGTARWAMHGFSRFLKADLSDTGIKVSLVVPGKVNSNYFRNNPGSEDRIPTISNIFRTLQVEEVADRIVRTIEKGRGDSFLPMPIGLTIYFHRLFPRIVEWLMLRTGWKRKK